MFDHMTLENNRAPIQRIQSENTTGQETTVNRFMALATLPELHLIILLNF